jgi:hypothetical protein
MSSADPLLIDQSTSPTQDPATAKQSLETLDTLFGRHE